jgi:hypothetical protein
MNHRHRKVLHGIFAHPLNRNLDPQAVAHVLVDLGAELHATGGGATRVSLNGAAESLHLNHHDVGADEVMKLRHLIEKAGVDPQRDYPL